MCPHSGAAATPVRYKRDIQQLTYILTIVKYSENNGTEKISLVAAPPDEPPGHQGLTNDTIGVTNILPAYLRELVTLTSQQSGRLPPQCRSCDGKRIQHSWWICEFNNFAVISNSLATGNFIESMIH